MCMSWLQVCTYAVYLSPSQHTATSMAPAVLPGCCFIHLSPTEAKRRYALQQTKRSINKHLTLDSGHESPRPSTQWVFQRLRIICRVTLRATPDGSSLRGHHLSLTFLHLLLSMMTFDPFREQKEWLWPNRWWSFINLLQRFTSLALFFSIYRRRRSSSRSSEAGVVNSNSGPKNQKNTVNSWSSFMNSTILQWPHQL